MKANIHYAIALFLVFLIGMISVGFSQNNCEIQLSADIQHCTCLNDGKITFKLTKSADCQPDGIRF